MEVYLKFLKTIMQDGTDRDDRTGVGVRSIFGFDMRFDLSKGFPLVTTKKCHFKSIVGELLWMLSGSTNIKDLHKYNISIWDEWASSDGDLGPVYGKQWRSWGGEHDQMQKLIVGLQNNPYSRRHIVNAWNVSDLDKMALPPCHAFMQFYVNNGKLSCKLTQRSADAFLGVPFNIASYSLLIHMLAQQIGLQVGEFIWSGGDCHIYHNHFDQVNLQLTRTPKNLPKIKLVKAKDLFSYGFEHINLIDYISDSAIRGEIAV